MAFKMYIKETTIKIVYTSTKTQESEGILIKYFTYLNFLK